MCWLREPVARQRLLNKTRAECFAIEAQANGSMCPSTGLRSAHIVLVLVQEDGVSGLEIGSVGTERRSISMAESNN